MDTVAPNTEYPRVVPAADFDELVDDLRMSSPEKRPDISITYQSIPEGIRILAVGSLDECAIRTGEALEKDPGLRDSRVRSRFVRVPGSRFRCL